MSQVGREHSDSSRPTSLLKHACPRARFTGLYPDVSGILPVRKMAHPLGSVPVYDHPHSKEVIPHIPV